MKTLGVIGGLGPMATAYFMQLVIDMTEAMTDQEHIPMIIYNCPQIPDRTSYLLGKSQENPGPQIIDCGKKIGQAGAGLLRLRIPVAGRAAFHNVSNIHIFPPDVNCCQHPVQQLARRPHKGSSGQILIPARTFSHQHNHGIGVPLPEGRVGSILAEGTGGADRNPFLQFLPVKAQRLRDRRPPPHPE